MNRSLCLSLACLALLTGCTTTNPEQTEAPKPKPDSAQLLASAQFQAASAQEAARQGNVDVAIEKYLGAVRTYRDLPEAWNNLGVLLMNKSRNLEALEAFGVAAELSPTDPRPVANQGTLWERQRYYTDAGKAYDQALDRDPNYLEALRGAIRVAQLTDLRDEKTAERIKKALLLESDPQYRAFFERQKIVVEGGLRERGRGG